MLLGWFLMRPCELLDAGCILEIADTKPGADVSQAGLRIPGLQAWQAGALLPKLHSAQALVFLEGLVRWFEYTFKTIASGDTGQQWDIL